jgi:hypothetical protein
MLTHAAGIPVADQRDDPIIARHRARQPQKHHAWLNVEPAQKIGDVQNLLRLFAAA